jgi:hypothetical protein
VSVNYIVFTPGQAGEAGVYSGAGFVFPSGTFGDEAVDLDIWHANMALTDRTGGFADRLGPAALGGKVTVRRDDALTMQLIRQCQTALSQRLAYPRLVQASQAR